MSRIEAVLRRRAARHGRSLEEQREADRIGLSRPGRPDCLEPFELELAASGELCPGRIAHLEDCPICGAIVEVMRAGRAGPISIL